MSKRKCVRLTIDEKIQILRFRSLKSLFNSKKLSDIIERIESDNDVFESYKRLTVKDAIIFINYAWQEVCESTIINCFKHAKWYGQNQNHKQSEKYEIDVYQKFLEKAKIQDPLEVDEFTNLDFNENDTLLSTDLEEIKVSLLNEECEIEDDDQIEIVSNVTKKECYKTLQVIKDYFNQVGMFNKNATNGINEQSKALQTNENCNTLDNWIIMK